MYRVKNVKNPAFWRFSLLLFFLGLVSVDARSETLSPLPTAIPRIIFGVRESSRNSPIVQVREAQGSQSSLCTGSVIAPSAVLTAWHCVTTRAASMSVVVNGRRIGVKRVRIHPQASISEDGTVINDVAILILKSKVSVKPLPILLSKNVSIGDLITISGFGLTENQSSGALFKGTTAVDEISSRFIVTVFESFESNTCSGDSGGPAIFGYQDPFGVTRRGIVGTTSTGTSSTCLFGDRTNFINIQNPAVSSFIRRRVPQAIIN